MEINPFSELDHLEEARTRVTEQLKGKDIFDRYLQTIIIDADIQSSLRDLMQKRSIETAEGAQLDVIGRIVGQPRELINTSLIPHFAFEGYPNAAPYGDLYNAGVGGVYYSYGDALTGNTILNDEQYRLFIRAKIAKNKTRATPDDFLDFISFVFGSGSNSIILEGNAEFVVLIGKELSGFERTLLSYISRYGGYESYFVPKPTGVRMSFGQFSADNFFGFQGAPNAKGYGSLVLDTPPEGTLLLDFEDQSYTVWEPENLTVHGDGKWAELF